jgi:flagellar biosynthesis protein FlhG
MSNGLSRIKLWSIGGGKGGIGKSLVTLGLGLALARLGKKVVLIDGDLGGANLHTLMGIRYPEVTLEHFLLKKVARLEEVVIETQVKELSLICGADDILGAANPTYAQKIRLLNQIEELPAQYVLLDLGAGTSFNLLDFFNYSSGKIALFTSQATSLQNAYGFIKSALYRKLAREFAKDDEVLKLLYQSGNGDPEAGTQSIRDLTAHLKQTDPQKYGQVSRILWDFNLFLVVNMVKSPSDLKAPEIIRSVCTDFLSIQPEILGAITFDPAMEAAVSRMAPFHLEQKKSKAAAGLNQIALIMVKKSRLPKSAWRSEAEELEKPDLPVKSLITHPSYFSGS